jgi:hypothetical protein
VTRESAPKGAPAAAAQSNHGEVTPSDPRGAQYHYCRRCGADLSVMGHLDGCEGDRSFFEDRIPEHLRDAPTIGAYRRGLVPSSNGEGVYLVRASEIEPQEVDYFDEPDIPLKVVTLMTGVDGVGKSTILYSKGAGATRGKRPGKFYGAPVDVVIASSEDHPNTVIIPRLKAAGADLERVHIVKVRRQGLEGEISLPDDLDAVALEVGRVGARLLIVDPLIAHMPLHVDSYKAPRPLGNGLSRPARRGTQPCRRRGRPFQRRALNGCPVPYFGIESTAGRGPVRARMRYRSRR